MFLLDLPRWHLVGCSNSFVERALACQVNLLWRATLMHACRQALPSAFVLERNWSNASSACTGCLIRTPHVGMLLAFALLPWPSLNIFDPLVPICLQCVDHFNWQMSSQSSRLPFCTQLWTSSPAQCVGWMCGFNACYTA